MSRVLRNVGPGDALGATAGISFPTRVTLITPSLSWDGGGTAAVLSSGIRWSGPLAAGARVTLTYQVTLPAGLEVQPFYSVAFLEDGWGGAWERPAWMTRDPWRCYLPILRREG